MSASPTPTSKDGSELPPLADFSPSLVLLNRAQTGDRAALNELLERYYDRVYRIVRIRMGAKVRGAMESCDLVQNTLKKAAEKLGSFQPRGHSSLINWLAAIAENQIRDAADRIKKQEREVPIDDLAHQGSQSALGLAPPDGGPSPSSMVANAELREIYDACVESLPDRYRELILLRDYSATPWEDIARTLGIPGPHAAQEMYRRAQIKLAGLLRLRLRG
ncbi:MAG: RNA polymerase sigma factor [Planctomycetes bacterium]|nr:RNA polymerase sigma factor [Planctomycetota bacterium]